MADKIGPNFYSELVAAGVAHLVAWNTKTGVLIRCLDVSDADFAKAEAVLAKHDPNKLGPVIPPTVSGDALVDSLPRDAGILWDAMRLLGRPVVPATNAKLKRIAEALKTTPDKLLAGAAS